MEASYIKLPIVRKIGVRGYGLFEKDWEYTFMRGLNLFVGGNRLGKTTTMYIILYGIIGLAGRGKSFFSDRVRHDGNANSTEATVKLSFLIGNDSVEIERDLLDPHINYFSVNGTVFDKDSFPNIEELYEQEIVGLAGISLLDDYRFLLEKLLIREEEGNYLLWNTDDQVRVLRLLFNYVRFDDEFKKLREKYRRIDSTVRGQQDIQAQFRKRQRAVQREKSESIKRLEKINPTELQRRNVVLTKDIGKLKVGHEQIITSIKEKGDASKELTATIDGLSSEIEELDSEIMRMENSLFQSIYSDPKIQLANHKLKNYQICMFCNQKLPKDKVQGIVNEIDQEKRCPVCNLPFVPLGVSNMSEEERDNLIKALVRNKDILEAKWEELSVKQSELDTLTSQLGESWIEEARIKEELRKNVVEADDIRLTLSNLEMGAIEEVSVYDRNIRFLQSQIDYYQGEIDKAKPERDQARKILEQKNLKFNQRLEEIRDGLVIIFKDYTASFLGECRLVARSRRTDISMIPVNVFIPEFDGRERYYKIQASSSEATFLEYCFRLSLCQLFKQITGGESLLAIETSEGIFDMGSVSILTETISKFYDVSHLLIISNLGRSDFLEGLVRKTDHDITNRVLNYFEISKLNVAQERDKEKFNAQLQRILGNPG